MDTGVYSCAVFLAYGLRLARVGLCVGLWWWVFYVPWDWGVLAAVGGGVGEEGLVDVDWGRERGLLIWTCSVLHRVCFSSRYVGR